jgi:RNA polymerase sigma-70 factor (ECF subfamily)
MVVSVLVTPLSLIKERTMSRDKRLSDVVLIDQVRAGSIVAFEELVSRYESTVYNLAMRFTRNQEDAEEVLQDVFLTIFTKVKGFEGKSAFSSWLYRVIVNSSFMKLRKRRSSLIVAIDDEGEHGSRSVIENEKSSEVSLEEQLQNSRLREILAAAVDKLPDQYRAVFLLRDVEGLSNTEVGNILDLSIPAVKSRLHRARLMLRRKLHRLFEEYVDRPVVVPVETDLLLAAN